MDLFSQHKDQSAFILALRMEERDSVLIDSSLFQKNAMFSVDYHQFYSGKIINKFYYLDGGRAMKQGLWYYFNNAYVTSTGSYHNNRKNGYWAYYRKGFIKCVILYDMGKRVKKININ